MSCFSRSAGIAVFLGVLLAFAGQGLAVAAQTPPALSPSLLPQAFGGWLMQVFHTSKDPASADPSNVAVLKEYRFSDFASATYNRDDGRTLKIRAARFADASGAFGAYTFYLQPEMNQEQIGDQGASLGGKRVLFYRGNVLVDAVFSQESAMSGAELRELAGDLPRPAGFAGNLPTFIEFMPRRGYLVNTQKYVMGPAALGALAAPVSAGLVDFGDSSEVSLGRYNTPSGEATLMLISYPTPQLAANHLRRIDAAEHQASSQPGVAIINSAGPLSYKRTGPLLAIVAGPVSESDAKTLLGSVNYEATVTWNEPSDQHDVKDLYLLIVNVIIICAIIGGLAIVAGVAFGGFRILMKRWFPDKVFDRPEQMEFISLHLTETVNPSEPPRAPENRPNVGANRS
jgi:hypothetical protein